MGAQHLVSILLDKINKSKNGGGEFEKLSFEELGRQKMKFISCQRKGSW